VLWGSINATISPPVRSSNGLFHVFGRGSGGPHPMVNRQTNTNFLQWNGFTYLGDDALSF